MTKSGIVVPFGDPDALLAALMQGLETVGIDH